MIRIDRNFEKLANFHWNGVQYWVEKTIEFYKLNFSEVMTLNELNQKTCKSLKDALRDSTKAIDEYYISNNHELIEVLNWFTNVPPLPSKEKSNIEKVIKGTPKEIWKLEQDFKKFLLPNYSLCLEPVWKEEWKNFFKKITSGSYNNLHCIRLYVEVLGLLINKGSLPKTDLDGLTSASPLGESKITAALKKLLVVGTSLPKTNRDSLPTHLLPLVSTSLNELQALFIGANVADEATQKEVIKAFKDYLVNSGNNHFFEDNWLYHVKFKKILESIFDYGKWRKTKGGLPEKDSSSYEGYDLAKELQINVCPYCNRNYTTFISEGSKGRILADFDHFFDKGSHPLFSLSFYNLIPSCKICNSSFKSSRTTTLESNIHPYFEGFGPDAVFRYYYSGNMNTIKVNFLCGGIMREKTKRIKGNIELFRLKDSYNSHGDVVQEILDKKRKYNLTYYEGLKGQFKEIFSNEAEFYQYVYGNFYNLDDFENRPFAKLTKDIYDSII